jgi:uncharacterized protein (TIGR00251 family)
LVASWIRESEHGALVEIRALPGARKSEIVGEQNGRLKIRLNAPPVEGKANKELLRLLAKQLGLKKSQVRLHTGDRSRDKIVLLADVTVAEAQRILKVPRGE